MSQNDYDRGYRDGLWQGKIGFINNLIAKSFPANKILPGYDLEGIIKEGIKANKQKLLKLLSPTEIYKSIDEALRKKNCLSIIRLGDGEAITLAQGLCKSKDELNEYDFLEYAGLNPPDYDARNRLANAILEADIVGVPTSLLPDFQPLLIKALEMNKIDITQLILTNASINYTLFKEKLFHEIIFNNKLKVGIVGNRAMGVEKVINKYCKVTGIIPRVSGVNDVPRVLGELGKFSFDLLLVPAGIPAAMICSVAAKRYECVAFDMGHLANKIANKQTIHFDI